MERLEKKIRKESYIEKQYAWILEYRLRNSGKKYGIGWVGLGEEEDAPCESPPPHTVGHSRCHLAPIPLSRFG